MKGHKGKMTDLENGLKKTPNQLVKDWNSGGSYSVC